MPDNKDIAMQILTHHLGGETPTDLDQSWEDALDDNIDGVLEDINETFGLELDYGDIGGSLKYIIKAISKHAKQEASFVHEGKWYSPTDYFSLQADTMEERGFAPIDMEWDYEIYKQCKALNESS